MPDTRNDDRRGNEPLTSNPVSQSNQPQDSDPLDTTEETPLLARQDGDADEELAQFARPRSATHGSAASNLLTSIQRNGFPKGRRLPRWPSIIALSLLSLAVLLILLGGYFAPQAVQEYSTQAANFKPTKLSIESFTDKGVVARIQGEFTIDASRVGRTSIRNFGRFATYIASEAETGDAEFEANLPERDGMILGTAKIPPIKVGVQNGDITFVDVLTKVKPGSSTGLKQIASDWIDGRLGQLRVQALAEVPLKTGIINLGKQSISQSLNFEVGGGHGGKGGPGLPQLPKYQIDKLDFQELVLPDGNTGLSARASINVTNNFPVQFKIPPMGFAILVEECVPGEPSIMVADAITDTVDVKPNRNVSLDVTGFVRRLPQDLMRTCPDSEDSPLDTLVGNYIHGKKATVYVRGSDSPSLETPDWLTELAYGITVPLPVPGQTFGDLIKNFSMSDVHFSLPDFFAEPGDPDSQPKISATVRATVGLPEQIKFPLEVHRIRSTADVFYHDKKIGYLDLHKWQAARSKDITDKNSTQRSLLIKSDIHKAPLTITDEDAFSEVVQALFRGTKTLKLLVKAKVDVELQTALGTFVVRQIPAKGDVPVKAAAGGADFSKLAPRIGNIQIGDSDENSVKIVASVNFTNPTPYSATIPFADLHVLANHTVLGSITARNMSVRPGNNTNILVGATWAPAMTGGQKGKAVGRELLSQYLSGYNTSIVLKAYEGSIPSQPALGRGLENFEFEIPTPRLGGAPGNGEDKAPSFIADTTMHIFSSTATFTLSNPLSKTTIYLTYINATAFYHGDVVGRILNEEAFDAPPGLSETPRLPVDWNLDSVGFDAVKRALGGTLKVDARADTGLRIGRYEQSVWYVGKGIGTKVRI